MFALANALYSRIRKRPVPEDDDESLPSNAGKRTKPSSAAEAADPTNVVAVDEAVIAPVTTAADVVEASEVEEDEEEDEDEASLGVLATSLPTVAQMYTQNMLQATTNGEVFTHDAALNDKIIIHRGDITQLRVDAIVNAANKALLGGGGVDGAIHRAAGRGLRRECVPLNGAETGESKITGGHDLPCKHVIHTVGPIYSSNKRVDCERQLRSCYVSTLDLAVENGCRTLAFSGISTGVYGYPIDAATRVALDTIRTFLMSPEGTYIDHIIFTVFRQIDVDSYMSITPEYFPPPPAEPATVSADVAQVQASKEAESEAVVGAAEDKTAAEEQTPVVAVEA